MGPADQRRSLFRKCFEHTTVNVVKYLLLRTSKLTLEASKALAPGNASTSHNEEAIPAISSSEVTNVQRESAVSVSQNHVVNIVKKMLQFVFLERGE